MNRHTANAGNNNRTQPSDIQGINSLATSDTSVRSEKVKKNVHQVLWKIAPLTSEEKQLEINQNLSEFVEMIENPNTDSYELSLLGNILDRADMWVKIIKTGKLDTYNIKQIGEYGKINKYHPQVRAAILESDIFSSEQLTIFAYAAEDTNVVFEVLNTGKIDRREDLFYLVEEYGYYKPNAAILAAVLNAGAFSREDLLSFAWEYRNTIVWKTVIDTGLVSLEDIKGICGAKKVQYEMQKDQEKRKIKETMERLGQKYESKEEIIQKISQYVAKTWNKDILHALK